MANFIDPSKIEEFKLLQLEGKQLASVGDLKASLQKYELAKQICPTPKVLQRIEKLKCNQKPLEKKSISSAISPQSLLKFEQLKNEAKQFANDGKYIESVNSFKRALSVYDSPVVKKYIAEIESIILTNNQQIKELENQSSEKQQHASNSSAESSGNNSISMQSGDTKVLTENFKDELAEKKHSSESVEEKSSLSDYKNDSDIEQKLAEADTLYKKASDLAADADGKITDALELLKKAQAIHETLETIHENRRYHEDV